MQTTCCNHFRKPNDLDEQGQSYSKVVGIMVDNDGMEVASLHTACTHSLSLLTIMIFDSNVAHFPDCTSWELCTLQLLCMSWYVLLAGWLSWLIMSWVHVFTSGAATAAYTVKNSWSHEEPARWYTFYYKHQRGDRKRKEGRLEKSGEEMRVRFFLWTLNSFVWEAH